MLGVIMLIVAVIQFIFVCNSYKALAEYLGNEQGLLVVQIFWPHILALSGVSLFLYGVIKV